MYEFWYRNTQRLSRHLGALTLLFSVLMCSSFAAPDIELLLHHAETELKNPLTFKDGIADLYIILHESSYKEHSTLERKLLSLIKQAQHSPHARHYALEIEELSRNAVATYADTRHALELSAASATTPKPTPESKISSPIQVMRARAPILKKSKTDPVTPQAEVSPNSQTQQTQLATSTPRRSTTRRTRAPQKKRAQKSTTRTKKKPASTQAQAQQLPTSEKQSSKIITSTESARARVTRKKSIASSKNTSPESQPAAAASQATKKRQPRRKQAS